MSNIKVRFYLNGELLSSTVSNSICTLVPGSLVSFDPGVVLSQDYDADSVLGTDYSGKTFKIHHVENLVQKKDGCVVCVHLTIVPEGL